MQEWLADGYQVVVTADHGMDTKGIHCGIADPTAGRPSVYMQSTG